MGGFEEAYVDTIIWYYQEVSRWFDEDLVSEVVFWFDVAHVPDHSQSYPAWSWGEQTNMCFEVPMKRDLMALVRAQEEVLDFERLQLRWQLRVTAGLRRTSTTVSSVFLATQAQGLQLDIARSFRTGFVDRAICSAERHLFLSASRAPVCFVAPFGVPGDFRGRP